MIPTDWFSREILKGIAAGWRASIKAEAVLRRVNERYGGVAVEDCHADALPLGDDIEVLTALAKRLERQEQALFDVLVDGLGREEGVGGGGNGDERTMGTDRPEAG